jgi:hypothetical protein
MRRESPPKSRARPLLRRWVWPQFAAALVLILGQLLGAVHLAVVRHLVCEHGELIHASDVGTSGWALSELSDSFGNTVEKPASNAVRAPAEHEHCLLQALRRESMPRGRAALVPLAVLEPARACAAVEGPEGSDLPLLRLAPKHSPPV